MSPSHGRACYLIGPEEACLFLHLPKVSSSRVANSPWESDSSQTRAPDGFEKNLIGSR